MRFLRFIPYFSRAFGGPVNHAKYLSRALDDRGHETTIYTTNLADRSGETTQFDDSDFDVRVFPARTLVGDYYVTPGMAPAVRDVRDYDVIHAHGYRNFQADLAAFLARLTDTPFVLTAHGTIKSINRRDAIVKGVYDLVTLKRTLKWTDRCIAVAEAEVDQYANAGVPPEAVEVIHHGVDIDRFSPDIDGSDFVEAHGLEASRFVLYAGRLHERKGLQYLIPAVQAVAREHDDVRLVIAGPDYGYEDALRELCHDLGCGPLVHFVGHLDQATLIQAYNAAYLVCYPSQFEIFGHTLTEAGACGTACVATAWGAAPQIIEDGETGRLLGEYGNVEELAAVLDDLLSSPETVSAMGTRARTHISREFSWDACAERHEAVYEEICSR